MEGNYRK